MRGNNRRNFDRRCGSSAMRAPASLNPLPKETKQANMCSQPVFPADTSLCNREETLEEKKNRLYVLSKCAEGASRELARQTISVSRNVDDIGYSGRYYRVYISLSMVNIAFIEVGPIIRIDIGLDCDVVRLEAVLNGIAFAYGRGDVSDYSYDGPMERTDSAFSIDALVRKCLSIVPLHFA